MLEIKNKNFKTPDLKVLQKFMQGGLIWAAIAFFLFMAILFSSIRVGRVTGEQVGVLLNKMNGKITIITQSGARIYNGITSKFYVLDKTLQTLDMTAEEGRGDRREKDDLKIKTIDGSDVYVDLKIQYKINPDMANIVITTSGTGEMFKEKWARDYLRSICRNYLGELTTEEFYDASKRNVKLIKAKDEANKKLNPFGIEIDSVVIPTKPHFYQEYEDMIKKKKLADQAVLEERSKAQAAKQRQQTLIVEETNKKNVAIEQFKGEIEQKIISAKAEADKQMKAADAYYQEKTIGAEALLYQMKKSAEGILAKKKSEAKGIEKLKEALQGEGGRNMVKLEYAKKLKDVTITGKPVTVQSTIQRFEHLRSGAASSEMTK